MLQNIIATPDKNNRYHKTSLPYVRPFQITWHGKSYEINNVNNYHTSTENGVHLHIFTASDGEGTFELKFTDQDVSWFLES